MNRGTAKVADDTKCLGVFAKFCNSRVFIRSNPALALATKKLFNWILADLSTQKKLYPRQGEYVPHQLSELYKGYSMLLLYLCTYSQVILIPSKVSWLKSILFRSKPGRFFTESSHESRYGRNSVSRNYEAYY